MRTTLLAAALVVVPTSAASAAPGLNLGWNLACPTTASSAADMSFACDNNGALFTIIGSARAPAGLSKVTAEELVFDLQDAGSVLVPWWHVEDSSGSTPAGCRGTDPATNPVGSLSLTPTFVGASTATCKGYWGTSGSGGQNYVPAYGSPDYARLQGVFARLESSAGALAADIQFYVANIAMDSQHTIPDPTDPTKYVCSGCQDGVCIIFNSCKFDQPPGTPIGDITVSTQDVRAWVTWQGGSVGKSGCGRIVRTRRATWGHVKSLYRWARATSAAPPP